MGKGQKGLKVFRQTVPDIGLSVELGTESVPDDGKYHIVLDGRVLFTTASKAQAVREYTKLRDAALAQRGSSPPGVDRAEALRRARAFDELRPTRSKGVRGKLRIPSRRGRR